MKMYFGLKMLGFPKISVLLMLIRISYPAVVKKLLPLLSVLVLSAFDLWGQSYPLFQSSPGTLTCVWNKVPLRQGPGKTGAYVSRVFFGEQVEKLGEEAYVPEEKRTYVRVRTTDGKSGWVHEYLFVPSGTAAVVLQAGQIYDRPNTPSTITMKSFEPGEIVVMENAVGDWVHLVGREKKKAGWIKGLHKITVDQRDIEFATLLASAREDKPGPKQQEKLAALLEAAQQAGSVLTPLIASLRAGSEGNPELIASRGDEAIRVSPSQSSLVLPRAIPADLRTETVRDPFSGQLREETIESGSIYPIQGPASPRTPFYAYHKTLPIGSRVFLRLPGDQGVVALEIVNRLREDNPHMLGMSPASITLLFGDKVPETVQISYLRP